MPEALALGASRQSLVGRARSALPDRRLPQERSLLRSLSRARDRWMVLMSMALMVSLTLLVMLVLQIALRLEVRSLQLQLRLVLLLEMEQLRPAQARQMESPALWEPAPLPGSIPRRWLAAPVL